MHQKLIQFVKLSVLVSQDIESFTPSTNLFTTCILFITRYCTLTMQLRGNVKQKKTKIQRLNKIKVPLVGLLIMCNTTNIIS